MFSDPKIGGGGPYTPPQAPPVTLHTGRYFSKHMPYIYLYTHSIYIPIYTVQPQIGHIHQMKQQLACVMMRGGGVCHLWVMMVGRRQGISLLHHGSLDPAAHSTASTQAHHTLLALLHYKLHYILPPEKVP